MTSHSFEQVLTLAQADGGLNPAFKKFLQTKFFVPIHQEAMDMQASLHATKNALMISEVAERVQAQHGYTIASLAGAEIVRHLHADADILIALSDRAFTIARDRVQWLKQVVEAAHAKAASQTAPVPSAAAAPVTRAASVPPAAPAAPAAVAAPPATPVPARRGGVLDVAALRPREIARADIGLSLFIPGAWTDTGRAKTTFVADPAGGTRIEISGAHRPGMSLAQWVTMRLGQVAYDQRFLQQAGESYPLEGDDWSGQTKGMATEFTGVFPGEHTESRFMVACIWTEGTVASITFRASAEEFENCRSLYKWLINRVAIAPSAPVLTNVYRAPGADLSMPIAESGDFCDPPVFGFSLRGRIGRLRSIAYCWPMALAFVVIGWLASQMVGKALFVPLMIIAGLVALWFSLRLTVLRLHDVNLTGKLVILFFALSGLSGVLRNPGFTMTLSLLSMIGMVALFYLVPGTDGDNDCGPPPAPNTQLIQIGAYLMIALQVLAIAVPVFMFGSAMVIGTLLAR